MEIGTRHLIYFSRDPSAELQRCFDARGWRVDVVDSARELRRAAARGGTAGGCSMSRAASRPTTWATLRPA